MKNNPYCTETDNCDKTCKFCKDLNEETGKFPNKEFFDLWRKNKIQK